MEAINRDRLYTYADYITWSDDIRCELIDGVVYMLAAPSLEHQSISFELSRQIGNYLIGKSCRAFTAPVDVRLNADKGDNTVIQPDLIIVCDKSKLDSKGCNGAPDMVAEILSPSTSGYDKVIKFNKYLQSGVREYWLIDPSDKTVSVYLLKDGEYVVKYYGDGSAVPVQVLDDCTITLSDVFAE